MVTRKEIVEVSVPFEVAVSHLLDDLRTWSKHIFDADWQFYQYSQLRQQLPDDWLLSVVDFAENYRCRFQDEIAAAYYQYQQASIFPCQLFYKCSDEGCEEGCEETVSHQVVLISDDLLHDHHLVRHFNAEIIGSLPSSFAHHVQFSDGCAAQFKSKGPFYDVQESSTSFEKAFFGSRHGKSPCDTIGGVLKSVATRYVKSRKGVIKDAKALHTFAQKNMVIEEPHRKRQFTFVSKEEVDRKRATKIELATIPGTRSLHSVKRFLDAGEKMIKTRKNSCFCQGCKLETACENQATVGEWKTVTVVARSIHKPVTRKRKQPNITPTPHKIPARGKSKEEESSSSARKSSQQESKKSAQLESKKSAQQESKSAQLESKSAQLESKNIAQQESKSAQQESKKSAQQESKKSAQQESKKSAQQESKKISKHVLKKSFQQESRTKKQPNINPTPNEIPARENSIEEERSRSARKSSQLESKKSAQQESKKSSQQKSKKSSQHESSTNPNSSSNLESIEDIKLAFSKVRTYAELSKVVQHISFSPLVCASRTLTVDEIVIDQMSLPLVPPEVSSTPASIYADGNCLPRVGSLFAYHTEELHDELRYRMICELVRNEKYYLSKQLDKGGNQKSAPAFAMFSECYNGQSFEDKSICQIYQEEMLTILKSGTYMGAWQVASLASVLDVPVRSVYPIYAGVTVRKDLNRMFYPRAQSGTQSLGKFNKEELQVLWTNTQEVDLKPREWRPNHFVLLIPK